MSYVEILILRHLTRRPAHGYELRKRVEQTVGVLLHNNSLYPALKRLELPLGEGFVWIAAEAKVARAARDYTVNVRRHSRQWLRASGYWIEGRSDAYERLDS